MAAQQVRSSCCYLLSPLAADKQDQQTQNGRAHKLRLVWRSWDQNGHVHFNMLLAAAQKLLPDLLHDVRCSLLGLYMAFIT